MCKHACLAAALCAAFISGCKRASYTIEMRAVGYVLERKLMLSEELPKEELVRIEGLYAKRLTPDNAQGHIFLGTFREKTPDDVGGTGSYSHFDTRMGSASVYIERFRGNDSPVDTLDERLRAADKLVDLLIGWLASVLEGEEGFEKLREFMDSRFRKDVRNAAVYIWKATAESGPDPWSDELCGEAGMRIAHYFAERGYFSVGDLPAFARGADEPGADVLPDGALLFARRLVARAMELPEDEPLPDSLAFLSRPESAWESLEGYIRSTAEFQDRLKEWEEKKKDAPQFEEPRPADIPLEMVLDASGLTLFEDHDELTIRFSVPTRPFMTNGVWDEKGKCVQWSGNVQLKDKHQRNLPMLCFAVWSDADAAFQQKHLGKLVFEGEELFDYCVWRESLTDKEAAQWDGFVAAFEPGEGLLRKLEAFRFTGEEPNGSTYARTPLELMIRTVRTPEKRAPEEPRAR